MSPSADHRPGGAKAAGAILRSGQTCWRQATARRFALSIDAADYFVALKAAMLRAERTIFLIGWDFDFRIRLDPESGDDEWPDKLGPFINALVKRRPNLEIRLLKWDVGALKTLVRGSTPLYMLAWIAKRRVHLRLDHAHPTGACHHQKIVVIDDAFAFCGGIDVTIGRWDTRLHKGKNRRRDSPWGFAQDPWHDATAAVDGEAARALGELARERWFQATGEAIEPVAAGYDPWPPILKANFTRARVGIARSQPNHEDQKAAHEIEALYLAAIRVARRSIYIESQYCASRRIGEALAGRLKERGGPEIIIINPQTSEGWLEEEVMGSARAVVVGMLREQDREDRFRIYHPVAADGTPIYVHAKIMAIDDRLLKIGSSNLNNRSMGFDTECDLAIEAVPDREGAEQVRSGIAAIVNGLLAEHLASTPAKVAGARKKAGGSLIGAIERLARPRGRTLKRLELPKLNEIEASMVETRMLDPERPEPFVRKLKRLIAS